MVAHRRHHNVSWSHVEQILSGAVRKVEETFRPSMLVALNSGGPREGGCVPALMLKAHLQHDGFANVPLKTMNVGGSVSDTSSWTPELLNGAHVLLVEKADDSR